MSDVKTPAEAMEDLRRSGDVMALSFALLTEQVMDMADAGPWDSPTRLLVVQRNIGPATELPFEPPEEIDLDGEVWTLGVNDLKVVSELLAGRDGPDTAHILHHFAGVVRGQKIPGWTGDPPVGVVLLSEAWVLTTPTKASERSASRAARRRTIHTHPQREEVRMIIAVDSAGIAYNNMHWRSGRRVMLVDAGKDSGNRLDGDILGGLKALMEALA